MLTPYLPYPLYSGGQIRTYNLLKHLSEKHEITLFSFIRSENERNYIPQLREFCREVKLFKKRPPWSFTSLFLSATTIYPLVVCMYYQKNLKEEIQRAIEREHFDLIHAETFYVMPNIPQNHIPTILVEQTIEYLVYKHFTEQVRFPLLKSLMNFDVKKIYFWEKKFWQRATRVVAMSEADKNVMQSHVPRLTVDIVPNGVDTSFFSKEKKFLQDNEKIVLFVGNFKWLQNREAVNILIQEVWPKIQNKLRRTKLWIVGRFPPKEILNYSSDSIKVSADIEDIRDVYKKADVMLAPIFGPGGTRYKILEAMAVGIPVVTTSTGIEGLDVVHGKEALIADNPSKLAEETIKLLTNMRLYKTLAINGRKIIENKYNWEMISASLDKIYKKAIYDRQS